MGLPVTPLQEIIRHRNHLHALMDTLPLVQAQCPHRHVGQSVDETLQPVRVCFHCGLSEDGSAYSTEMHWCRRSYDGLPYLHNEPGRTIQPVDPVTYQRMRVDQ